MFGLKPILAVSASLIIGAAFIGVIWGTFQRETTGRMAIYGPGSFTVSPEENPLPSPDATSATSKINTLFISSLDKAVRNQTTDGNNEKKWSKMIFAQTGESVEYQIDLTAYNQSSSAASFNLADVLDAGVSADAQTASLTVKDGEASIAGKAPDLVEGKTLIVTIPARKHAQIIVTFGGVVAGSTDQRLIKNVVRAWQGNDEKLAQTSEADVVI
jgi:hypothetical protein